MSGNSWVVQRLGLFASPAGSMGSIPGWGTKIPHVQWCGPPQKKDFKFYLFVVVQLLSRV